MTTTVWVTGANGFSGRQLISALGAGNQDIKIVALDLVAASQPGDAAGVAPVTIDLTDAGAIRELLDAFPPRQVYHLAGAVPPSTETSFWTVNVGATFNLLRAFADLGDRAPRVLVVGSAAEFRDSSQAPITEQAPLGGHVPYGHSKTAQGLLAQACGTEFRVPVLIARTFNLLGPGLSEGLVAAALCAQFAQPAPKVVKVGNVNSERDFIDVRDAVRAYITIMESGTPGRAYNVCTGSATRIETLVKELCTLAGAGYRWEIDRERIKSQDSDRVIGDCAALQDLGWQPQVTLRESLAAMLEAARD